MNVLRHLPDFASPTWAGAPPVRASAQPVAGPAKLCLECLDVGALASHVAAWTDLCARALEPNIFLDPAFALPLFQNACPTGSFRFLLVWEEARRTTPGRLLGLFVLDLPRWRGGTSRAILHRQTSNGTPLVDHLVAGDVITAALGWLGARSAAFAVSSIDGNGPFAAALRAVCASSARRFVVLEERSRAVLKHQLDDTPRVASFASATRRKQARRLARKGQLTLTSAETPAELAAATERFLVLEKNGWKGARGTALLTQPALASFARRMTQLMGEDGRCRIDAVEIDGQAVAMGIILTDRGRAHFWKIAFDEAYASFSPGVQLALELTRKQLADPAVTVTDSCAEANHPMIDKLWPDRIGMIDVIVAVGPAGRGFASCVRLEHTRRAVRKRAKTLWHSLRHSLRR